MTSASSSKSVPPIDFEEIEAYLNQFGEGETILSDKYYDKGLAVIYFNNPSKKNAISGKMMVQFRQTIEKLEQWKEGKAVLLCGIGGNFCSGGDLSFAKISGTKKEALYMANWMQDSLTRLQNLPMFSVSLIEGPTLGGGAEIPTFTDFIVAADNVRYGLIQGKMGILTAWGGGTGLVKKVGYRKALRLMLTSPLLSAQNCLDYGVADHVVPASDCFEQTIKWIEASLQHHYSIVRSFKEIMKKASEDSEENSLAFEKSLFSETWGSELNREALAKNIKHVKSNSLKL